VNRLDDSEEFIRSGLEIWATMLGEEHPIYARGHENLAKTLLAMKRSQEALAAAESALRIHEAKLGPAHFWTRESAATCARALGALGRSQDAQLICDRFVLTLRA